ncbi:MULTISPECIES: GpE family phage tail protein [unclassified Sphingomonas]|uniref:GpE family phage tail protein n=1 Tax=unclassified Sphingomonas TaxID=196159 RepID=UPI0012E32FFA
MGGWPPNWRDALAALAQAFHWGPSELMQLTWPEIEEWLAQARRLHEGQRS